jgi:beta-glucosidase
VSTGFQGTIISDFEGVYTRDAPIIAGVDIEMPGPAHCRGQNLVDAVREGHIPESKIDILALHVLELAAKVGMDD